MTVYRSLFVEHFARVRTDQRSRVAIHALSENRTLSFDDVWLDFNAFHEAFRAAALPRRSAVVSLLGNRASFVPVLLAAIEHGAVLIPLDAGTAPAEVHQLVEQFGAAAIIAPEATELPWAEPGVALPCGLGLFRTPSTAHTPDVRDASIFKLTSGSTGKPKAIVCSEANLIADGRHIVEAMGISPHDVNMAAIPLSHSYGLGNLVMPLILQGSSLVLRESFLPARFLDDVERCGATVFPGVPFMFEYLRQHLAGERLPASLRLLLTAGASIQYGTVDDVRRIFGLKIHSFYGTSETGGIAYDDSDAVLDSLPVGHCLPDTSVTIWPVEGADEDDGRVHVRSDAVAAGYAGSTEPEESAAFCDGGFLTGDLGHFDADGRLILTGRLSPFLNVAGRKVHPDEVERVLLQMPQIAMARVVGLPCDTRGEMLVACVVTTPDHHVTATSIRRHCSQRLSSYKIPRQYVFLDHIPLDQRGKTDRRTLEALAASRIAGVER